uniref:COMM domain-containing protein n=1 Tax=Corethrella appendiculata TaxID=1370023 RepID=U5EZV3_9DIPT
MSHLIKSEQDEHLKFLVSQPDEVLIEFCKLAIDYITNGINEKKCTIAAKKLNSTQESISSVLQALVCLLIDCTVVQITEEDFQTLNALGFNESQINILWQFVSSKRQNVENILQNSNSNMQRFRDLEWRLEARIASRSLQSQATPIIKMKIHLDTEIVNEHKDTLTHNEDANRTDDDKLPKTKKEILLQTDPTNLSHMIQVLEQALLDSKTHRIRNIVKSFQKK